MVFPSCFCMPIFSFSKVPPPQNGPRDFSKVFHVSIAALINNFFGYLKSHCSHCIFSFEKKAGPILFLIQKSAEINSEKQKNVKQRKLRNHCFFFFN